MSIINEISKYIQTDLDSPIIENDGNQLNYKELIDMAAETAQIAINKFIFKITDSVIEAAGDDTTAAINNLKLLLNNLASGKSPKESVHKELYIAVLQSVIQDISKHQEEFGPIATPYKRGLMGAPTDKDTMKAWLRYDI